MEQISTMITAFLLMPVIAVLVWLYWSMLPVDTERVSRWCWRDTLLLALLPDCFA